MLRYVLDTMIVEAYLKGDEKVVRSVSHVGYDGVCTTIITRAEILRPRFDSILKETDPARLAERCEWLTTYEDFFTDLRVLSFDRESAAALNKLRNVGKLKGVGINDLKIASIALANSLVVVTRNVRDFRGVPMLDVKNWMD